MPAVTLNVNNFLNIEENATKLSKSDFPKIYLATSWYDIVRPINLMFPWQPCFDKHVFGSFEFLAFLIRIFPFSLLFSHF